MKIAYIDTEGNGNGSNEQICQLSYLVFNDGAKKAVNRYFTVNSMNPHAYKVHGLSKYRLAELSGGKRFVDCADEVCDDLCDCDYIIGHNVRADIAALRTEFQRCKLPYRYRNHICTMRHFSNALKLVSKTGAKRYPKLSELCSYYNISEPSIQIACDLLFGAGEYAPHDARFDVAAVYMCIQAAKKAGDIRGVI